MKPKLPKQYHSLELLALMPAQIKKSYNTSRRCSGSDFGGLQGEQVPVLRNNWREQLPMHFNMQMWCTDGNCG